MTRPVKFMRRLLRLPRATAFASLLIAPFVAPHTAAAADCAQLARLALPKTEITSATTAAEGTYQVPEHAFPGFSTGLDPAGHKVLGTNPEFCRIKATLRPSADSDIKVEVWLPTAHWNGKFMGVGSFGWGGSIMEAGLLSGLQEGYAVANTDTGHSEFGGKFALGHPEKLIDYGYRANHGMTVFAKAMIKAFYGHAQTKSFWVGCSLGGLEGLIEAKRYPGDYDGVVAGAPPNPLVRFNAEQLWASWLVREDPRREIPKEKLPLVHNAVVAACGTETGRKYGYVDQPDRCTWDPGALLCPGDDAPDCLTAPQVFMMRKIYQGPVNPRTGESIFPGPAKGAELGLVPFIGPKPMVVALDIFRYAAFQNADWDSTTMDWDKDVTAAIAKVGPLLHVDKYLRPFFKRGGKLLLYIGWTDGHNGADLITYYKGLIKTAGPASAKQVQLYTIPGMAHCGGGQGCDTFSKIGAIDAWVVKDRRPGTIVATKVEAGAVTRSFPLCAYPKVAKYKGSGDMADAGNFACTAR